MLLSYRRERSAVVRKRARAVSFLVCLLLAWVGLDLNIAWRGAWRWPASWQPLLLFPAAVSAWICSAAFSSDQGIRRLMESLWRPASWKWPAIALFSIPALLLVQLPLAHALKLPVVMPNPGPGLGPQTAYGVIAVLFNFFIAGVLEEPGWRGFLLNRLQSRFSPLTASLMVWLPWALWHLPMDLAGSVGNSLITWFWTRVVLFIPLTILFTWFYNRSQQALASAVLFHTALIFANVVRYTPASFAIAFVWAAWALIADRMWRSPTLEQERTFAAQYH